MPYSTKKSLSEKIFDFCRINNKFHRPEKDLIVIVNPVQAKLVDLGQIEFKGKIKK